MFYATWSDNSSALQYNSDSQAFKSYALAKICVRDFGKAVQVERMVNLSSASRGALAILA